VASLKVTRIYTVLLTILMFVPIGVLLLASVSARDYVSLPSDGITFQWYVALFRAERLLAAIRHSVIVAGACALISTISGAAAAMALAHVTLPWRRLVVLTCAAIAATPVLFVALPALVLFAFTGVPRGLVTVIAVLATVVLPLPVFISVTRLSTLDPHLRDAASLLGARWYQIEFFVVAPLLRRSLLVSFVLTYMICFGDVIVAYFLGGHRETLPTALYSMTRFGISPVVMAACSLIFLTAAASIVVVASLQRRRAGSRSEG
jgi:ABC-type spermidine/putrescine transport system permease subunit II